MDAFLRLARDGSVPRAGRARQRESITRSKFNVDVARMSRTELDLAIKRIQLPRTAVGAMPPLQFRQLDADARTRLVEFLRSDVSAADAALQHAAKEGMRGGARAGQ